MRSARHLLLLGLLLGLLLTTLWPAPRAQAHTGLEFPNGGESYANGEVVTIQWHISISHPMVDWDLWYATDAPTPTMICGDQLGVTWLPIELDIPVTCTNGGGSCVAPGGCTMQYLWTVPEGIESDQVKIRVRMDNTATDYYDVSNEPFTVGSTSAVPEILPVRGLLLWQNYPNPLRHSSTIPYALVVDSDDVDLVIHSSAGRMIRHLVSGGASAGAHFVVWDGTDDNGKRMPAGTYFYSLTVSDQQMTRKLILVN